MVVYKMAAEKGNEKGGVYAGYLYILK